MAEQDEFESTEQELAKVRGCLGDTVELFRRSTDEWAADAKNYRERIVKLERELERLKYGLAGILDENVRPIEPWRLRKLLEDKS